MVIPGTYPLKEMTMYPAKYDIYLINGQADRNHTDLL